MYSRLRPRSSRRVASSLSTSARSDTSSIDAGSLATRELMGQFGCVLSRRCEPHRLEQFVDPLPGFLPGHVQEVLAGTHERVLDRVQWVKSPVGILEDHLHAAVELAPPARAKSVHRKLAEADRPARRAFRSG